MHPISERLVLATGWHGKVNLFKQGAQRDKEVGSNQQNPGLTIKTVDL